jgi:hypothetical protein
MARLRRKPQTEKKHPDTRGQDLNPNRLQGQNIAPEGLNRASAADVKELVVALADFRQDELEQIPLVPAGERLKQGAVYLDLGVSYSKPFTATADTVADDHHLYVPKADTPYEVWNRLTTAVHPQSGPAEPSSAAEGKRFSGPNAVSEEMVDKTLADSFPSSDPPSWTTGRDPTDKGK